MPERDQHRRPHFGRAQPAHHLVPLHVRQADVEHDDVEVIVLGEVNGIFARLGRLADDAFALQGGFYQLRGDRIVLNNQSSHYSLLHARSQG
jgi:hypothetical protein